MGAEVGGGDIIDSKYKGRTMNQKLEAASEAGVAGKQADSPVTATAGKGDKSNPLKGLHVTLMPHSLLEQGDADFERKP